VASAKDGVENKPQEKRAELGDLIRRLRETRQWTLADASKRCGLSLSTISRIENNQLSLSFGNLVKLANGFNVDISDLFHPDVGSTSAGAWSLTRRGEGDPYSTAVYDYKYLCGDHNLRRMVPVICTVKCRTFEEFGEPLSHPGQEYLYVLEDAVDLMLEGSGTFRLWAGDSFYFNSSIPHALISVGGGQARVLSVIWSSAGPLEPAAIDRANEPPAASD
jgi:transcriptional regulator with XRE-family HTH domain